MVGVHSICEAIHGCQRAHRRTLPDRKFGRSRHWPIRIHRAYAMDTSIEHDGDLRDCECTVAWSWHSSSGPDWRRRYPAYKFFHVYYVSDNIRARPQRSRPANQTWRLIAGYIRCWRRDHPASSWLDSEILWQLCIRLHGCHRLLCHRCNVCAAKAQKSGTVTHPHSLRGFTFASSNAKNRLSAVHANAVIHAAERQ